MGRVIAPTAVGVQVLVADHVARHIARGLGVIQAAIALAGPTLESIGDRRVEVLVVTQTGATEAVRLPGVHQIRASCAIGFALSLAHDDVGGVALGIDAYAVSAGSAQGKCQLRGIDLHDLAALQVTHRDVQRALRQLQLRDAVVQVDQRQAGVGAHTHHGTARLDLGAPVRVGPQAVSSCQRPVQPGLHPFVLARCRKTDCTSRITKPRNTCRWVGQGAGRPKGA